VIRAEDLVKWSAEHYDGFSSRLLGYTLQCESGVAELEANWFRPEPSTRSFRKQFLLDDTPLMRALPALLSMQERYEAKWDGVDIKLLAVESNGSVIRRHVYGGGVLVDKQPELQAFLDLFVWLEGLVVAQLPWPQDAVTDGKA
jgi:hypothetical protein